jgi:hypothetical protein
MSDQLAKRDRLLQQGTYEWDECRDCDFIGFGRPASVHALTHRGHQTVRVLMPFPPGFRRGRPVCSRCDGPPYRPADRIVNGRRLCLTHFYQEETVVEDLARAARADELRDDAVSIAGRADRE